jgi:long-subunit acyl-CoA synthetase (AMP-forming)
VLFVEEMYGRHSNSQLLREIGSRPKESMTLNTLNAVVVLRGNFEGFPTYDDVAQLGKREISDEQLEDARLGINTHDVCNLQYTSGSTGQPKAAMLTHL